MPKFGALGKFFGSTVSTGAGFAAGVATAPALAPAVQEIANEAWSLHPDKPLSAGVLAAGVASGEIPYAWAQTEAEKTGISKARFDHLVDAADEGPGIAQAYRLWRRDIIDTPAFRRAAKRASLEQEWIDALVKAKNEPLDPAVLAVAVQRGIIPDPGILPVSPPAGGGKVESFPVFNVDALDEAAAAGIDRKHFSVMVGNVGNPASPQQAANAYFRGIIEREDYDRAIAEGNTRNEWRDAILEQSRPIPSVTNYVEALVRDWITRAEYDAGIERHGMTKEDGELLYLTHGRPLSWHQTFIGLARGGAYDGDTSGIDPAFLKSLRESNIRPEWYALAWAQRYNYPTAFVLRSLVSAGDLTAAEGAEILRFEGWEPGLADKVTAKWATGTSAASKEATATDLLTLYSSGHRTLTSTLRALENLGYPTEEAQTKIDVIDARRVVSEETRVITALHKGYIDGDYSETEARTAMTDLGVAEWARDQIVRVWNVQKGLA